MEATLSAKALRQLGASQVGRGRRKPVSDGAEGQNRSEGRRADTWREGGKRCRRRAQDLLSWDAEKLGLKRF